MFVIPGRSLWSVALALAIAALPTLGDRWPGNGPDAREPTLQAATAPASRGLPAQDCHMADTPAVRQAASHEPGACRASRPGGSFPPCPPAPASC
jgi:hypothetical protein